MPSPSQRIETLEKELEKYNFKRNDGAKSFSSIKEDIAKRIKILNLVHSELMSISTELFYYNMVDHLGNTKIEFLTLQQCISLFKELDSAMNKFIKDNDQKYILKCEKLKKKVLWAGCNITKDFLDKKSEDGYPFIKECPEECREKLRKHYFALRNKALSKMIKECKENIEKSYQLLITGELLSYEKFFKEKTFDENLEKINPASLEQHLKEIMTQILIKKNKSIAKAICMKLNGEKNISKADKIFKIFVKEIYRDEHGKSIEI